MKLWVLKQYEESSTEKIGPEIIGIFQTEKEALSHISDELPEWAELWKSNQNENCYTNGLRALTRYVAEVDTGKVFDGYKQFKKHYSHDVKDFFPKLR